MREPTGRWSTGIREKAGRSRSRGSITQAQ
jgi:hypothetical protein